MIASGGWHVRLPGKVRPAENVGQKDCHPCPYDLRVGVERQTGFLVIKQPRQSRTTHLVPNGRLDKPIKSFPPGSHNACSLDLLDKAGGFTSNQRAEQRILVRKIVVQRADAGASQFGHRIRGEPTMPLLLQNASRGFNNRIHRVLRPRLPWMFPWAKALVLGLCSHESQCE
jgi:hypothetical protein